MAGWQVIPSVKKEEAIRIYVEAQVDIPFHFLPPSLRHPVTYVSWGDWADDGFVRHNRMHGGARRALRAAAQAAANLCQD
jgi:hypothetical protein